MQICSLWAVGSAAKNFPPYQIASDVKKRKVSNKIFLQSDEMRKKKKEKHGAKKSPVAANNISWWLKGERARKADMEKSGKEEREARLT